MVVISKNEYNDISFRFIKLRNDSYLRVYHEVSQWVNFPTEFSKNDVIISFFNMFPINGKLAQKSQCVSHISWVILSKT